MYLYQNFLTLGEERKAKSTMKVKYKNDVTLHDTKEKCEKQREPNDWLKHDSVPVCKSFNTKCDCCNSDVCLSAFNYDFHKRFSRCEK